MPRAFILPAAARCIALALHTREASSEDAVWSRFQLLSAAADFTNAGLVRVVRGHDVLELLADAGRTRADALSALQQLLQARHKRPVFTLYVGEDTRDDDAFDAVPEWGAGAVVGRRQPRAAYHLATAAAVDLLVDEIIRVRRNRRRAGPKPPRVTPTTH